MTVKEIIENFYAGLAYHDSRWQRDLADDVVFSDASGKLDARGKQAFIQAFEPFLRTVAGVQLKRLIVEGGDACAVVSYDYVSPTGARLHQNDAEVWRVADGKIAELTIYFDVTEYRAFMGR